MSNHSHCCLATTPPISWFSEGTTPTNSINFNPQDIYGSYPKDFCTMTANNDATREEVSTHQQGGAVPTQTWSRSHSRSAPRVRGRPAVPHAAVKTSKAAQQLILAILNSATKAPPPPWQGLMPIPTAPPLFSTIASCTNSPTIAPATLALASATVGMSDVVKKH